jgi:hypothetical protein
MKQERFNIFRLDGDSKAQLETYIAEKKANNLSGMTLQSTKKALGLESPVVCVDHYLNGLPRAYKSFPQTRIHPHKDGVFFMYSPIGYNGDYFVPKGATPATPGEIAALAHSEPESVIAFSSDIGTDIPADYDPAASNHRWINNGIVQPDRNYAFFEPHEHWRVLFTERNGRITQCFNLQRQPIALDLPSLDDPIIRMLPSGVTLAYPCEHADIGTLCPKDFKPMSAAKYQWLVANFEDAQRGASLPPLLAQDRSRFGMDAKPCYL